MRTEDKQEHKIPTEVSLFESLFEKPIALWTYDGGLIVNTKITVLTYELMIDGSESLNKLEVLFAFERNAYDLIKKGIRINHKIQDQQLRSIKKLKDRPKITDKKGYEAGTKKNVRTITRTGHVFYGYQVWATHYYLILRIRNQLVLVYKHGLYAYEVTDN